MVINSNQPQKDDAVLGGDSQTSINGIVLNTLREIEHCLSSEDINVKVATLSAIHTYIQGSQKLLTKTIATESSGLQFIAYDTLYEFFFDIEKQALDKSFLFNSYSKADYRKLRSLLIAQKWAEADIETDRLMLNIAGRQTEGYLDIKQIESFPIAELKTIDYLWTKYSNGRFGFSVQKRIYQRLGGNDIYNEKIWEEFGDRIGWVSEKKRYFNLGRRRCLEWKDFDQLTFNLNAPKGHLPWCRFGGGFVWDSKTSSEVWRGTLGGVTLLSRTDMSLSH